MVGVALLSLLAEDSCEVGLSCGCDEELWPELSARVDDSKSVTHVLEDEEWFALCVCHDADVVAEVVMSFISCSPS